MYRSQCKCKFWESFKFKQSEVNINGCHKWFHKNEIVQDKVSEFYDIIREQCISRDNVFQTLYTISIGRLIIGKKHGKYSLNWDK